MQLTNDSNWPLTLPANSTKKTLDSGETLGIGAKVPRLSFTLGPQGDPTLEAEATHTQEMGTPPAAEPDPTPASGPMLFTNESPWPFTLFDLDPEIDAKNLVRGATVRVNPDVQRLVFTVETGGDPKLTAREDAMTLTAADIGDGGTLVSPGQGGQGT